ncbi:hypothetical protein [Streptomyces lavendulae]|nr:hypothetical protein Sros01_82400 [Streptomyces roseochromogenus]
MTDDDLADALRDAIDTYLTDVDPHELESDDLSWTLVRALRRAEERRTAG